MEKPEQYQLKCMRTNSNLINSDSPELDFSIKDSCAKCPYSHQSLTKLWCPSSTFSFTIHVFFLKNNIRKMWSSQIVFWLCPYSGKSEKYHRLMTQIQKQRAMKICKPALFEVDNYDLGIGNSNFNFYTWLNADGSDLLHNLRRAVQVNESFMDTHLETIPGLGAFTTRCLPGSDSQNLEQNHRHRVSSWCTQEALSTFCICHTTVIKASKNQGRLLSNTTLNLVALLHISTFLLFKKKDILGAYLQKYNMVSIKFKYLGRHAHRSFHFQVFLLSASDQVSTDWKHRMLLRLVDLSFVVLNKDF